MGVGISSLVEREVLSQLDFFGADASSDPEKDRAVSRILDDLRERFGDKAILPGRMLEEQGEGPDDV